MLNRLLLVFILLFGQLYHSFASICGRKLPESKEKIEYLDCVDAISPSLTRMRQVTMSDEDMFRTAQNIAEEVKKRPVFTKTGMNKLRLSKDTQELFQYVYGARLNYLDELDNILRRSKTHQAKIAEILEDLKSYFEE